MKTTNKQSKKIVNKLVFWSAVIITILLIPFATKAPWTSFDYIFAGTVLTILATIYEYATRNVTSLKSKSLVGFILLGVIVLIIGWAAGGPD